MFKVVRVTLEVSLMTWKKKVTVAMILMNPHSPKPTVCYTVVICWFRKALAIALFSVMLAKTLGGTNDWTKPVASDVYSKTRSDYSVVKTRSHSSRAKKRAKKTAVRIESYQTTTFRKERFCKFRTFALCLSWSASSTISMFL